MLIELEIILYLADSTLRLAKSAGFSLKIQQFYSREFGPPEVFLLQKQIGRKTHPLYLASVLSPETNPLRPSRFRFSYPLSK